MNSLDIKAEMDNQEIDCLIEALKSKDGIARQHARNSLVKIGEPALDMLIKAFEIKKDPLHWEIAKALSQIGTPKAARTLVDETIQECLSQVLTALNHIDAVIQTNSAADMALKTLRGRIP